ncbi:MAG: hypothetical protein ABL949_12165 [Fimbriimonadaceae bacterium]
MRIITPAIIGLALILPVVHQEPTVIDTAQLKGLIEGLGYDVRQIATNPEPGREKYEFKITKDDLNVPIGAEVSPSKRYVWLTVFLGPPPTDMTKHTEMLKRNGKIQPCFFYITEKGNLMIGLPVENRQVSSAVMRRTVDLIVDSVVDTKSVWQNGSAEQATRFGL